MATTLETIRSVRIGPFAVFDFTAALAGMWWLAPKIGIERKRALWLTLPAGIVVHQVLGLQTPFNRMVFGPDTNIMAQIAVAFTLFKGLTLNASH